MSSLDVNQSGCSKQKQKQKYFSTFVCEFKIESWKRCRNQTLKMENQFDDHNNIEVEENALENAPSSRQRSSNFTLDEDRVLQETWAKHKDFLSAPQSNKVTNAGKALVWESISSTVSALGYAHRSATSCKTRIKNLTSTAKRVFNEHKNSQRATGGGPPPKAPSASIMKTIELLKDTSKFKGVDGGISTFTVPSPPDSLNSTLNSTGLNFPANSTSSVETETSQVAHCSKTKNPLEMLTEMAAAEEDDNMMKDIAKTTTVDKTNLPIPTPFKQAGKRRHYDTTADVQMRVLQREEEIQRKKEKILEVELRTKLLEEEVALLNKRKVSLEVAQLEAAAKAQQSLMVNFIPNAEYTGL